MAGIVDTLGAGLEQVAPEIRDYRDFDEGLMRYFKPSKRATVSRWLYRTLYKRWSGGAQSKVDLDGGALPDGTGPVIDYFYSGFYNAMFSLGVTQEQINMSETSEQGRMDVVADILENALNTLHAHDNTDLFGDGSGKLTNAASTGTSTTLTFADSSDTLGTGQLFRGRVVDIWDNAGTTLRAGGPYTISAVDHKNKKVTFTAAPTAMGTTDLLTVPDLDSYGPAAPTTASSTWPGDSKTAAGLTGDSWIHGLKYVNSTGTYFLGKARASYPELQALSQDMDGEPISFELADLLMTQMINARDKTIIEGAMAVMNPCQQAALKAAVTVTSVWQRGASDNMYNKQPGDKYNDTFAWGQFTGFAAKQADKARVDIFNPGAWGTVENGPAKWFKAPDGAGSMFWMDHNTSGKDLAKWNVRLMRVMDLCCEDPQTSAWAFELAVPAGY